MRVRDRVGLGLGRTLTLTQPGRLRRGQVRVARDDPRHDQATLTLTLTLTLTPTLTLTRHDQAGHRAQGLSGRTPPDSCGAYYSFLSARPPPPSPGLVPPIRLRTSGGTGPRSTLFRLHRFCRESRWVSVNYLKRSGLMYGRCVSAYSDFEEEISIFGFINIACAPPARVVLYGFTQYAP